MKPLLNFKNQILFLSIFSTNLFILKAQNLVSFHKRLKGEIGEKKTIIYISPKNLNFYYKKGKESKFFHSLFKPNSLEEMEYANFKENLTIKLKFDKKSKLYLGKLTNEFGNSKKIKLKEFYDKNAKKFDFFSFNKEGENCTFEGDMAFISSFTLDYIRPDKKDKDFIWLDSQLKKIIKIDEKESWKEGLDRIALNHFERASKKYYNHKEKCYHLERKDSISIISNDKNFLNLKYEFFENSHTLAHPFGKSNFYILDLKNKKRLEFSDVFLIEKLKELEKISEIHFAKTYGERKLKEVRKFNFQNKALISFLALAKNFYFNKNGIIFYYNKYEISYGADGNFEIFIPFKQLRNYLDPRFLKKF